MIHLFKAGCIIMSFNEFISYAKCAQSLPKSPSVNATSGVTIFFTKRTHRTNAIQEEKRKPTCNKTTHY